MLTLLLSAPTFARDVKVKIEGSLPDAVKLVERLNENGKDHDLRFKLVDDGYEFRIAVASEGMSAADVLIGGGADASAAILTPDCKLLFIVARSGRMTQSGALNAVSKEIVKKFARYFKATEESR
jgi:hypothetical protein